MPTPGGGGGGGGGGFAPDVGGVANTICLERDSIFLAYREGERQKPNLSQKGEAGELEGARQSLDRRVVRLAKGLQPIGQPSVDLVVVVAELVKRSVGLWSVQGEDQPVLRQQET